MTTGARLVSLSGLSSGTAMAHLLAITTGDGVVVVNDGISTEIRLASIEALLSDVPIVAELQDLSVSVEVTVPCH